MNQGDQIAADIEIANADVVAAGDQDIGPQIAADQHQVVVPLHLVLVGENPVLGATHAVLVAYHHVVHCLEIFLLQHLQVLHPVTDLQLQLSGEYRPVEEELVEASFGIVVAGLDLQLFLHSGANAVVEHHVRQHRRRLCCQALMDHQ